MSRRLALPSEPALRVLDGQHRIEGLRYAICEKHESELAAMPIPVVIVEIQDRTEEMNQFRIINGIGKGGSHRLGQLDPDGNRRGAGS